MKISELTGKPIPEVGTTRFRPPYAPVSLGSIAAERFGDLSIELGLDGDHFGFDFVMFVGAMSANEVLAHMADRMHNDHETERKVVRNELARINRTRLERMLGPEGGYNNW